MLARLVPDAPQVRALHALVLLQHSRREARVAEGRLVTLADQDRSRWVTAEIDAGRALLADLEATDGYAEELRLQALIAAEHARAPTAAATRWAAIEEHYLALEARTGSAVVRLNRAVATAEVHGPRAGLAVLDDLDAVLGGGHRLAAVRAELARRAGDGDLAAASYRTAIERCGNEVERDHLRAQLDALTHPD